MARGTDKNPPKESKAGSGKKSTPPPGNRQSRKKKDPADKPFSVRVYHAHLARIVYKGEEVPLSMDLKWGEASLAARIMNEVEAHRKRIDKRTH